VSRTLHVIRVINHPDAWSRELTKHTLVGNPINIEAQTVARVLSKYSKYVFIVYCRWKRIARAPVKRTRGRNVVRVVSVREQVFFVVRFKVWISEKSISRRTLVQRVIVRVLTRTTRQVSTRAASRASDGSTAGWQ